MLKLSDLHKLGGIFMRPYHNKDYGVLSVTEADIRGNLCFGPEVYLPSLRKGKFNTVAVLFVRAQSGFNLVTLIQSMITDHNPSCSTDIHVIDHLHYWSGKFRWEHFGDGSWQTREQVKARLEALTLNPAIIDSIFPETKAETTSA